jgi:hypothetical protein
MNQPVQEPGEEEPGLVIMTVRDFQGQLIKLTAGQWAHFTVLRPYLIAMEWAVRETLENPEEVRKSERAPHSRLYYRRYTNTVLGDKFMCVVVKFLENDAFISTAYLARKINPGELIWRK